MMNQLKMMIPFIISLVGGFSIFVWRYNLSDNISNDRGKFKSMARTAWHNENVFFLRIQVIKDKVFGWSDSVETVFDLVNLYKVFPKKLSGFWLNPLGLIFNIVLLRFKIVYVMPDEFKSPSFVIWHYECIDLWCLLEGEWIETSYVIFGHVFHLKVWNILFYHLYVSCQLWDQFWQPFSTRK